jgi:hypothetical protein
MRAKHIEEYLVRLHSGQWFGWSDSKNKVYANLIIHDDSKTKPTEQECIDGLETMQSEYDNNDWKRDRLTEYPNHNDCIHALLDGGDTLTELQAKRQATKLKFPKP